MTTDAVIDLSVVIPCRGHAGLLAGLLGELARQRTERRFEVLVVDSAVDDAVATAAEATGARVVRGVQGLLPGEARDLGASRAQGRMLAFIDADCQPWPTWLEAAATALERGARLAGGPVGDLLPRHPVAVADNLLQFADLPATRPAGPIHMMPSCNLAIGAEDYAILGGFRHVDAVPTGEDVALCARAEARWPGAIRFAPAMGVRHMGRTTIPSFVRHHRDFGYARGRLRLLLTERQARLGRMGILFPAIVARRIVFILGRVARYRPMRLPATLLLLPLLTLGIVAWTMGFRRGLADAARAHPVPVAAT